MSESLLLAVPADTGRSARRSRGFLVALLLAAVHCAGTWSFAQPTDSTGQGGAASVRDSAGNTTLSPDTITIFTHQRVQNGAFRAGERLVFDVSYGFITAGEAVIQIPRIEKVNDRDTYRVEFLVNSLPSFSWIYKVEDRYLTFIDTVSLLPHRFEQHIREGSYRRDFVADFDRDRRLALTTEGEFPIPPDVHDIFSAFFYARTIDYSGMGVGDSILLYNYYRDKYYELMIRVLGRQELEVEAGTFLTIVVEPIVKEGGLFKSEGRIVIWLTDDELKIPVRVNTKVVIGSIDSELREYSGLAGPLNARIR
jgi:hypothetical protein